VETIDPTLVGRAQFVGLDFMATKWNIERMKPNFGLLKRPKQ